MPSSQFGSTVWGAILAVLLVVLPVSAGAQDAANALIVEAVTAQRAATNISDPAERLAALEDVLATLDRIVTEYPTSPLAVQIVTEQPIGTLDVAAIRAEVAEIAAAISAADETRAAQAEAAARQESLPFLEREPPQTPCAEDDFGCVLQSYLVQPPVVVDGMGDETDAALRQASLAGIAVKIAFDDDASVQAMLDRMVDPTRRSGSTREAADVFEAMALRDGIAAVLPSLVVFAEGIVSEESRQRSTREDAVAALLDDPLERAVLRHGRDETIAARDALRAAGIDPDRSERLSFILASDIPDSEQDVRNRLDAEFEDLIDGISTGRFAQLIADGQIRPAAIPENVERIASLGVRYGHPRAPELVDLSIRFAAEIEGVSFAGFDILAILLQQGRIEDALAQIARITPDTEAWWHSTVPELVTLAASTEDRVLRDAVLDKTGEILASLPDAADDWDRVRREPADLLQAAFAASSR